MMSAVTFSWIVLTTAMDDMDRLSKIHPFYTNLFSFGFLFSDKAKFNIIDMGL